MTSDFAPEVVKYAKSILPQQQIHECASLLSSSISDAAFYARQHICYSAYMPWQFRLSVLLSVCLSVCHTGGSVKNAGS